LLLRDSVAVQDRPEPGDHLFASLQQQQWQVAVPEIYRSGVQAVSSRKAAPF
jgi:hypothetical protein